MVFEEAGTYTIEYTATDECGNTTTAERTVIVEAPPTYRTVLYTDGTFIINESSVDEEANVQAHGQPTNVYDPFDPNGDTNVKRYEFGAKSARPWNSQVASIRSVEIGSNISPTDTSHWFNTASACISMELSKLDTSNVTRMDSMFEYCESLTSLDVSGFNTSNVISMDSMFEGCSLLTSLDVSGFNTSNVTNMTDMFNTCRSLTSIDISRFEASSLLMMSGMFSSCSGLITIYSSELFDLSQVTDSNNMFAFMSSQLTGGAGTVWNSNNPRNKTYAHIDGGVSDPGYFTAKS